MNEAMKAAWIGLVGAIIGAVLGAGLAVVGAVHYNDWIYGPKEGVFIVDLTAITSANLDPVLRQQIHNYPCELTIRHIDGPSVPNVTVSITSESPIESLSPANNNETASITLSDDKKQLRVDIPNLRIGSAVKYNFLSLGTPKLEKNVTMSSGRLADLMSQQQQEPWYRTNAALIGLLAGYLIFVVIVALLVGRYVFDEGTLTTLSTKKVRYLAAAAAAFSVLAVPLPVHITDAVILLMLAMIYLRLEKRA